VTNLRHYRVHVDLMGNSVFDYNLKSKLTDYYEKPSWSNLNKRKRVVYRVRGLTKICIYNVRLQFFFKPFFTKDVNSSRLVVVAKTVKYIKISTNHNTSWIIGWLTRLFVLIIRVCFKVSNSQLYWEIM